MAALAALALAATALAAAGVAAAHMPAMPVTEVEPSRPVLPVVPDRPPSLDPVALLASVQQAPFRPDRRPPDTRYLLPSERQSAVPRTARIAVPAFRLTGTVLVPSGGHLAAIARPGAPSRLYGLGSIIDDFELVGVEAAAATLVGPDTTLVIEIREPRGGRP